MLVVDVGERDPVGPQRQEALADALHLGEAGEDQPDRLAYAQIGVKLDPAAAHSDIADGHGEEELAAPCFLPQRLHRAGAQEREFKLAHAPFHPQQKPVVRLLRAVCAVLVDDQRPDQAAELDQRVPVAPVARQPRRLDGEHGPDPALADRRQQPLEARTADARPERPRSSSMTVTSVQPRIRARSAKSH